MENGDQDGSDEWRLGIELAEHAAHPGSAQPESPGGPDPAAARLDRPLYVLTAEHLGWLLIAAYTIVTRLAALGARPITAAEARGALDALAVLDHGRAAHVLGWVVLMQSGIFGTLGASDFSARLFAAGCGILLVAAALAMRPYLGRAGAIAMGAILATSPTILWYSRAGTGAIAAAAFATVAVALLMASIRRPTMGRAIGMGAASALAISAGPVGALAALTAAAAAIVVGIYHAIAGGDAILRIRVWWTRRAAIVIAAVIVAVIIWVIFTTAFFSTSLAAALGAQAATLVAGTAAFDFLRGLGFYAPIFIFYEFAIVLAALAGLAAVVTLRVRSTFAVWLALWTVLSLAAYAAAPGVHAEFALGVIVPAAMLGAVGIDWIFRSAAWTVMGYVMAVIAAGAVYSQALTSAVYPAPDASEAPWARHALLYWSEPATTWQARAECDSAAKAARGGTIAFASGADVPAIRWYLRAISPAPAGTAAAIVVNPPGPDSPSGAAPTQSSQFVLEQDWTPSISVLTPRAAMRYFLSARAWTPMHGREIALTVLETKKPAESAGAQPAASPSATSSLSATPSATLSATPPATPAPTPEPTITSAARAPVAAATAAPPSPAPRPSPSPSRSSTPSATPSPVAHLSPSPTRAPAAPPTPSPSPL
jgi:predicted membrane-bound mannosyltransferase